MIYSCNVNGIECKAAVEVSDTYFAKLCYCGKFTKKLLNSNVIELWFVN